MRVFKLDNRLVATAKDETSVGSKARMQAARSNGEQVWGH
jgi:hypothetical protein